MGNVVVLSISVIIKLYMYNIINNCSYLSVSNQFISNASVYSLLDTVSKNAVNVLCGMHTPVLLSRKEYDYLRNTNNFISERDLVIKCISSESLHNTQIVDVYSHIWDISNRNFANHVNSNIWKVLSYKKTNCLSINGLVLSVSRFGTSVGISGIITNVYIKKFSASNKKKYRGIVYKK